MLAAPGQSIQAGAASQPVSTNAAGQRVIAGIAEHVHRTAASPIIGIASFAEMHDAGNVAAVDEGVRHVAGKVDVAANAAAGRHRDVCRGKLAGSKQGHASMRFHVELRDCQFAIAVDVHGANAGVVIAADLRR